MSHLRLHISLLAGLLLAGCNLAPRYTTPTPPVPDHFDPVAEGPDASPAKALPWTDFYSDPSLRQVLELACANNRDIRVAVLTVDRTMAAYRLQRSDLFPHLTASAMDTRQRIPATVSSTGKTAISETYNVSMGVTAWELDLFGRIRNQKQAAMDRFLGTEQARKATLISLRASVAEAYLTLAADREALALTQDTLASQEASLQLTEQRFSVGSASELDVHRARMSVEAARVDIASYTRLVALDRTTLNVLAGVSVPEDLLPHNLSSISPLRGDLSVGLPSRILVNRPDILQAEYQLKAANANIGAARAAYFPTISLTTSYGSIDTSTSGLFKTGSESWNFVPQASLSIFDFGARKANLKISKVDREIALAQYEKAIQTGYKEVCDALVRRDTIHAQRMAQEALANSTSAAFRLSTARFDAGIDSSLGVLDAQRTDLAARQNLIVLRRSELSNLVTLYKVLGGGAD